MAVKQAVLVIHGVGEQKPMQTLRSFVNTVWTTDASLHMPHADAARVWSKPYPLSDNFELRRLTTAENKANIRTDFFEFYWAHLMHGTKVGHVVAWSKALFLRSPRTVPPQLKLAYWTILGLTAVIASSLVLAFVTWKEESWVPIVWSVLSATVGSVALGMLLNYVGDAARYLDASPTNVQRRHEIRAAGVEVLKSLHARGYERIIVVGHSLGSVIGYDILNFAWSTYNAGVSNTKKPEYRALEDVEAIANSLQQGVPQSVAEIQKLQRRYFDELRANENKWCVSDFVTMGCPLTHAEILLAKNASDLQPKFSDREFPRCLPELELQGGKRRFSFQAPGQHRVPHHAAVFGPTRWTNIYFPNRLIVVGDLIGGPVGRIFGHGVRDRAVSTSLWRGLLSHTLYWTLGGKDADHIAALRESLNLLDERR